MNELLIISPGRLARATLGFVAACVLAACASNPATGGRDLVFMSEKDEIELGRQLHPQIMSGYTEYKDPQLQEYIKNIGERLAKNSHRPNLEYTFTLLDSEEVNAFAIPGGFIYITRGILTYLNSEAELAAVLGHEIAHVTARHSVRQNTGQKIGETLGQVASVLAGTSLAGDAAGVVSSALTSGYGRGMELEADELGAQYLAKSGYPHTAMIDVVRLLKDQEHFEILKAHDEGRPPRVYHGVFASHPDQDTRLQEVVEAAAELQSSEQADDNRYEFLSYMDGIPFGKKVSSGPVTVRGSEVYNHSLGIAITLPRGWRVQSFPDRLIAKSRYNDGTITMSIQGASKSYTPQEFIEQRLRITNMREGEDLTHGPPAHTGIVPRAASPYGLADTRLAVVYFGRRAFIFSNSAADKANPQKYDPEFFETLNSLRKLSAEENERSLQSAIRLTQVSPGMTVESLAKNSSIRRYPEETIRLINGLYPDKEPVPGDLVKTVE
ncbi:MAG: M48 family metalloprotease [Pseudomonadota bacterium]